MIDYEGGFVVFDDMLGSNQKTIQLIFTRKCHKNLNFHYLFIFFSIYQKKHYKTKEMDLLLYRQTLKDVKNIYRDFLGSV